MVHNLGKAEDRATVIREMLRVLRPGGSVLLTDINYLRQYARVAEAIPGISTRLTCINCLFCCPTRTLIVNKAS